MRRAGKPWVSLELGTVHADGDHRVASVADDAERRADGEAVDRGAQHLVRVALGAGAVEHVGEPDAEPAGGADVAAADLVGDAGHGDVALDERHRGELGEGQGEGLLDHAADLEGPAVDVDLRHGEVRVDAVELLGRGAQGRDAGDLRLEAGRQWLGLVSGGGQHDLLDRLGPAAELATDGREHRERGDAERADDEASAAGAGPGTEVGTEAGTAAPRRGRRRPRRRPGARARRAWRHRRPWRRGRAARRGDGPRVAGAQRHRPAR